MAGFELVHPDSLDAVCEEISSGDEGIKLVAGGVALSILIKQRLFQPVRLVGMKTVPGLDKIDLQDKAMKIGSSVLHRTIETSSIVRQHLPIISETFGEIANVRIRTLGTLGGELAHGDPHSDPPPVLIGLGAEITVQSTRGERQISASDFFTGYLETALEPDEVLKEVVIPLPDPNLRSAYMKFCPTTSTDWPCLGVAAFVQENEGICQSLDIIFGSATEIPHRVKGLGEIANGHRLDDQLIEGIASHCYDQVECISDGRGSSWYKRELVPVFARRVLQKALGRNAFHE